jgi:cell division septal protein FtsQ
MTILDRQSMRRGVGNRKLGRRRLMQRERQRASQGRAPVVANASGAIPVQGAPRAAQTTQEITLSDRRRPGRGFDEDESPRGECGEDGRIGSLRTSLGRYAGESLFAVCRILALVAVFPFQLVYLLVRPRDLMRRLSEAPTRVHSTARRLRLQTRDPDSMLGRLWESVRLSAHFVREEMTDMQDGFPSFQQVARGSMRAVSSSGRRVSRGFTRGLAVSSEDLFKRLHHSAALGVVAGIVVVGLFVAGYQGLESLKQSEWLTIGDITIQGLERIERDELLSQLRVGEGDNLLEIESDLLVERATTLPWVRSLALRRDLRGQRLELAVVEHKPVLLLGSSPIKLVNESGVAFKELEAQDPVDLPFLTVADADVDLSDPEQLRQASRGAVQILHALSSGTALTDADVSEIRYEGEAGYVVVTRTGLPVRVGREDFAARLGRLERAARSGALPLHVLASVDLGLRDRLVVVPQAARKARRTVRKRVVSQPIAPQQREQVMQMKKLRRDLPPENWEAASP